MYLMKISFDRTRAFWSRVEWMQNQENVNRLNKQGILITKIGFIKPETLLPSANTQTQTENERRKSSERTNEREAFWKFSDVWKPNFIMQFCNFPARAVKRMLQYLFPPNFPLEKLFWLNWMSAPEREDLEWKSHMCAWLRLPWQILIIHFKALFFLRLNCHQKGKSLRHA